MQETTLQVPESTVTESTVTESRLNHCWQSIGVQGDRSCPELAELSHCRNCTVYGAAGRELLNQPWPAGYQEEWAVILATPIGQSASLQTESVAIFRLQEEWFALSAAVFEAVMPIGPIRPIPQRSNDVLLGLVNIGGELQLCVSLAALLGLPPIQPAAEEEDVLLVYPRMVVVKLAGGRWVFPVDDIDGIERFCSDDVKPAPANVSQLQQHLTRGVIPWRGQFLSYLDETLLSHSLHRRALP
jgi:chemotaxis-related protein WspD